MKTSIRTLSAINALKLHTKRLLRFPTRVSYSSNSICVVHRSNLGANLTASLHQAQVSFVKVSIPDLPAVSSQIHLNDRSLVYLPPTDEVPQDCKQNYSTEGDGAEVHRFCRNLNRAWPKREEPHHE